MNKNVERYTRYFTNHFKYKLITYTGTKQYRSLTQDKVYEVLNEDKYYYYIKDDNGTLWGYPKSQFTEDRYDVNVMA